MENKNYYYKYLKYKSKYNSIKNNKHSDQKGGYDNGNSGNGNSGNGNSGNDNIVNDNIVNDNIVEEPKGNTISGRLNKVIDTINKVFVVSNSSLFDSKKYFDKETSFELSVNIIYKLSKEAKQYQDDKSYPHMMKLLQITIDRIDLFLKCAKVTFTEEQILYSIKLKFGKKIKELFDVPIKCFNAIMNLFNDSGINPDYHICDTALQQPHDFINAPNSYNINNLPLYFNLSAKYPTSYNSDNDKDSSSSSDKSDSLYDLHDVEDFSYNPTKKIESGYVKSSDTPVANTDMPVESVDTPVANTDMPVESVDIPSASTDTPVTSTDTPVASTDTPVTSTDTPVASTDTPVASTDTPVASTDTPVASTYIPSTSTDNNSSDEINNGRITRISFKNIDDTNFYFEKNGAFEFREGEKKSKNSKFNLEIYINNKKVFFIETSTKENSEWEVVNLFHNEDNLLEDGSYKEVQDIKYIIINDNNKRVKINYQIKPVKVLIERIRESIKNN